jgi:sulfur-oxidizing protein SoxX
MNKSYTQAALSAAGLAFAAFFLTSCATAPTAQQVDEATQQVLKSSSASRASPRWTG